MRDKLHLLPVQADTGRLVKLRRLFLLVFPQKNRVQLVFQGRMHPVMLRRRIGNVVSDPPVDKRMADRIGDVMIDKTGQIRDRLLLLLAGLDAPDAAQAALKKRADQMLVHVGTDIPVIPVPQDRNIIKKHVRPLQPQLIEPAVFGHNMLERGRRHIVVRLHPEYIMRRKARHSKTSFLIGIL